MEILLAILYAAFEGFKEAGIFSHQLNEYPYNVHHFFLPARALVFFALAWFASRNRKIGGTRWYPVLFFFISYALVYSFFHNGTYFQIRAILQPEVLGDWNFFTDKSVTSTALISFGLISRSLLAVAGLLGYFLTRHFSVSPASFSQATRSLADIPVNGVEATARAAWSPFVSRMVVILTGLLFFFGPTVLINNAGHTGYATAYAIVFILAWFYFLGKKVAKL